MENQKSDADIAVENLVERINVATNKIAARIQKALEDDKNTLSPATRSLLEDAVTDLEAFGNTGTTTSIPNENESGTGGQQPGTGAEDGPAKDAE